jgi:hypothetical protein
MNANETMTIIGSSLEASMSRQRSRAAYELVDQDEAEQADDEHAERERHGV